jgi:hypothetical protein
MLINDPSGLSLIDLHALSIQLARMEERQIAQSVTSDHRHRDMNNRLDNLATKQEVEAIEERVEKIEDDKKWLARSVAGTWFAGIGVIWALVTRKFS